jgi:hypothetical protein
LLDARNTVIDLGLTGCALLTQRHRRGVLQTGAADSDNSLEVDGLALERARKVFEPRDQLVVQLLDG